ncbi:hypothetical protein [Alkalicoccobacillus plakortidis]|uniref:Uncharacterized protein n=1 Tax=Alkalicoccobacillus plakortidis TaxID=444060 RepID=A0ABT0XHV8_9BACI|nr:hypothetical protein [Alkalicoccobacillus plakortidis]MCM2675491.1 hypothetical protein [Alkalicoccobacillus plakortidis]
MRTSSHISYRLGLSQRDNKKKPMINEFINEVINAKYGKSNRDISFFYSVRILIEKGYLDTEIFKKEINGILKHKKQDYVSSTYRLFNYGYWEFTDSQFEHISKSSYNEFKNGNLEIFDYTNGLKYFLYYHKKGLIKNTILEIEEDFYIGLKKAKKISKPRNFIPPFDIEDPSFEDALNRMSIKVKEYNEDLKNEKIEDEAIALFNLLPTQSDTFFNKIYQEEYRGLLSQPFFKFISSDVLYEKITSLENKDKMNLIKLISNCPYYGRLVSDKEEEKTLTNLIIKLEKYYDGRNKSMALSNSLIHDIIKSFKDYISVIKVKKER